MSAAPPYEDFPLDGEDDSQPAPPPRTSAGGANQQGGAGSFPLSPLAKRFPIMFEGVKWPGQWFPLAADLNRFLRTVLGAREVNARDLVLELFQHLDYKDPERTVVILTDRKASERTGIDLRNIQRTRRSNAFKSLVDVRVGKARKANYQRSATTYDLKPLMQRYNDWRKAT